MDYHQESLLILHGWQSSKEKWEKVKENLESKGIKVIVPDFAGFKEELNQSWSLDDYINWTEEFIEGHLDEPFFLLGHSFGGRIAINVAIKKPEKLRGLILVSSAGIKPRKTVSKLIIFKSFRFLPGYSFLRKCFYKFILRKTDYLKVSGTMKETFKRVIEKDLTPLLSQIKVETLILWGRKDKITPLSNGYLMNKEIKDSKFEVLEEIGHTPYLENPDLLSEKVINFIKKI